MSENQGPPTGAPPPGAAPSPGGYAPPAGYPQQHGQPYQQPYQPPPQHAPQPPAAPPERAIPDAVRRKMVAQKQQFERKQAEIQGKYQTEQQRAQTLESQAEALREEMRIKLDLSRAGVQDMSYAWYEISNYLRELAKDTSPAGQAKLEAFTVEAWAEEQRKLKPYIFGTIPVPATTGAPGAPGAPPAPPAPGAPAVAAAAAGSGAFDARSATPGDFEKRMRERGIPYSGAKPYRGG